MTPKDYLAVVSADLTALIIVVIVVGVAHHLRTSFKMRGSRKAQGQWGYIHCR